MSALKSVKRSDARIEKLRGELLAKWPGGGDPSSPSGETQNNVFDTPPGETGERGENPSVARVSPGRKKGELGRIGGEFRPFRPPEYPVEALGPLAKACQAIAEEGQLNPAMAGQCLLSAAALICQSHVDVSTLAGAKPVSLYFLTVGESGDGKSTAESAALRPVREYQRELSKWYAETCAGLSQGPKKKGEPSPEAPRAPYILMRDGTVEGIRRGFAEGVPSQGVFTSEAAIMLTGYGMNADNRAKTAGCFNALWDDGELSVVRALTGRTQLYDRRLSLHWLIQPSAAAAAMRDPLLSGMGFWARFLAAWPASPPPRKAKPFNPAKIEAVGEFWGRCAELLREPLQDDCADLFTIRSSREAFAFAKAFFERMEEAAKAREGELELVRPFALRGTELMFRIAGVLAHFAGEREINLLTMQGAARLVAYSLETWKGIFGERDEAEARTDAQTLLEWLRKLPAGQATETAILRIGPKALRSRWRRDRALATLQLEGLVCQAAEVTPTGGTRVLVNTWKVVDDA
jgi:hypothetical protein